MIELRRQLERGMKHPYLGPVFVLLVIVLTAFVFLHAAHDGYDAAADMGALCLGVVTIIGLVIRIRVRSSAPRMLLHRRLGRSPPVAFAVALLMPSTTARTSLSPLRL